MSRIRTIKPEFWTAEQVMELSRDARLLFLGMWNFCDDSGVHPAAYKTLKAEVFPGDDITSSDIKTMVSEIIAQGLLCEFEHDGRCWWRAVGWEMFFSEYQSTRPPRHVWLAIRARILARDDFTCAYCGARTERLECDHIIPISRGGSNDDANLSSACFDCNRSKGGKTLDEWRGY